MEEVNITGMKNKRRRKWQEEKKSEADITIHKVL